MASLQSREHKGNVMFLCFISLLVFTVRASYLHLLNQEAEIHAPKFSIHERKEECCVAACIKHHLKALKVPVG